MAEEATKSYISLEITRTGGGQFHYFPTSVVAISPDGSKIAFGGWNNEVLIYSLFTDSDAYVTYRGHIPSHRINALAWSYDGKYLASASRSEMSADIHILEVSTGQVSTRVPVNPEGVWSLSWSHDGTKLAYGSVDNTHLMVSLLQAQDGSILARYHAQEENVATALAWSPDDQYVAFGNLNGQIDIWDSQNNTIARSFTGHTHQIHALAFSPSGTLIASSCGNKLVHVWEATTGKILYTDRHNSANVIRLTWEKEGTSIRTGTADGFIKDWVALTGEITKEYPFSYARKQRMAHSLDWDNAGNRFAVGIDDRRVIILDAIQEAYWLCRAPTTHLEKIG